MSTLDRSTCDVLVAGAGPAGSHAAALLAARGLRVALLDQAAFPRDKVCGGGLSQKSLRLLEALPDEVVQRRFTGAWITWRNEGAIRKDLNASAACTVLRSEFDDWLRRRACEAGACFHPATRVISATSDGRGVTVQTSRGAFRAGLLLAADGVGSAIRAQVLGRGAVAYAPALEVLIPVAPATLERLGGRVVFDLGGMPNGYGWLFPKRNHLNAGVYSPWGGSGIRAHLQSFLRAYGLGRQAAAARICGHAIPVRNRLRTYEAGPVMLLGDAAGLADSVWGEGIYFALMSAELAARVVCEGGGRPVPGRYSALVRATLEAELRWSMRLARLLYGAGRYAFDPLARNRLTCAWFAAVITGELSYAACFRRTLLGAPAWLMAGRHEIEAGLHLGEESALSPSSMMTQ